MSTINRKRRVAIVTYSFIFLASVCALLALQSVALWLPFQWAYGLAANATVWPLIQVFLVILVGVFGAVLWRLKRRKIGIAYMAIATLCVIPTVQMVIGLNQFSVQHGIPVSLVEQANMVRSFSRPDQPAVKYGRGGQTDLYLSSYLAEGDAIRPAVVYVHGGGWSGGSRDDNAEFFRWLNTNGYHVFSVDYRTARTDYASWRDAPADVACALSWLDQHKQTYGIDMSDVTLMGDSAGGQISMMVAYTNPISSCGGEPVAVKNVVGIVPAIDFRELYDDPVLGSRSRFNITQYLGGTPDTKPAAYDEATIINHVKTGLPRTLIINAARDWLVSARSGEALARKLDEAGVEVEQYVLPYAAHSYWINPGGPQNQMGRTIIERFLTN